MPDLFEEAKSLLDAGDAAGAVPLLEELTRQEPDNWRAFAHLGVAYAKVGHYETAIGAFQRAVELNPNAANLRYNLGQAYEFAGVPEQALHAYDQALEIRPDYPLAQQAFLRLKKKLDEQAASTEL
ncbi:MAG: tetratricopeptide repeat protein [Armatimonadota bacterium]|jgi:superkiller protein 3|nr:MAG: hypothetical protein KatS3mg024_1126 [Armatimonadota bacterium]